MDRDNSDTYEAKEKMYTVLVLAALLEELLPSRAVYSVGVLRLVRRLC